MSFTICNSSSSVFASFIFFMMLLVSFNEQWAFNSFVIDFAFLMISLFSLLGNFMMSSWLKMFSKHLSFLVKYGMID